MIISFFSQERHPVRSGSVRPMPNPCHHCAWGLQGRGWPLEMTCPGGDPIHRAPPHLSCAHHQHRNGLYHPRPEQLHHPGQDKLHHPGPGQTLPPGVQWLHHPGMRAGSITQGQDRLHHPGQGGSIAKIRTGSIIQGQDKPRTQGRVAPSSTHGWLYHPGGRLDSHHLGLGSFIIQAGPAPSFRTEMAPSLSHG